MRVLLVVLLAGMATWAWAAPRLEYIYTLPDRACPNCVMVKSAVRGKYPKVQFRKVAANPNVSVQGYPLAVYSDLRADYGERVYSGSFELHATGEVVLVEVQP